MRYIVHAVDNEGNEYSERFTVSGYVEGDETTAHSTHLVSIMRQLDESASTLVAIAVDDDEPVYREDHHDMNRLYS